MDYDYLVAVKEIDGKYMSALMTAKGEAITPFRYQKIERLDSKMYCYKKDNKLGLLSKDGEELTSALYDDILITCNQGYTLKRGDEFDFISILDIP